MSSNDLRARSVAALLLAALEKVTRATDPPAKVEVTRVDRLTHGTTFYRLEIDASELSLTGLLSVGGPWSSRERRPLLEAALPLLLNPHIPPQTPGLAPDEPLPQPIDQLTAPPGPGIRRLEETDPDFDPYAQALFTAPFRVALAIRRMLADRAIGAGFAGHVAYELEAALQHWYVDHRPGEAARILRALAIRLEEAAS